ncbi:unnamed protein product [Arctia plantaginis]|uniref:Glutathione S-transferase n=1 Tax=Arctia plantaginis TaxID=874455 RepID=A0A8S0YQE8_ARCPL|nr:unnamed protein product [Arctia plantaginis]
MLADIIGLELDLKTVDFVKLEHKSPEYTKLNPLGTIPVLVDGDFVLSDSHAIMIYLLSKYGGDKSEALYPSDPHMRAAVNQILFFDASVYFIRLKVVALPTIMEGMKSPTEKHLSDIEEAYSFLEAYLSKHQYIACDEFTIADLSVGATTAGMQGILKLDANKYPRTFEWFSKLEQEPYFQKFAVYGAAALAKTLQLFWNKNSQE